MEENDELEVVSTTAARLSCALEVYLREVDDSSSSNKRVIGVIMVTMT